MEQKGMDVSQYARQETPFTFLGTPFRLNHPVKGKLTDLARKYPWNVETEFSPLKTTFSFGRGEGWFKLGQLSTRLPCEHLLNRLPQAHITRRRMQLSLGGAKIGILKMHTFEPCFHQGFQCSKLAWKNQCFRNISARRGIKRTEGNGAGVGWVSMF